MTYYLITQMPGEEPSVLTMKGDNYDDIASDANEHMEFENEDCLSLLISRKQAVSLARHFIKQEKITAGTVLAWNMGWKI